MNDEKEEYKVKEIAGQLLAEIAGLASCGIEVWQAEEIAQFILNRESRLEAEKRELEAKLNIEIDQREIVEKTLFRQMDRVEKMEAALRFYGDDKRRAERASMAPWITTEDHPSDPNVREGRSGMIVAKRHRMPKAQWMLDAEFIAHARQDVLRLCAAVDYLLSLRDQERAASIRANDQAVKDKVEAILAGKEGA